MVVESANGQIFTCSSCNRIHFEFLSTAIDFVDLKAIIEFNEFINGIDFEIYERKNQDNRYRRKVVIPFPNAVVKMMLTSCEGKELVNLVNSFRIEYLNNKKRQHENAYILNSFNDFPEINLN